MAEKRFFLSTHLFSFTGEGANKLLSSCPLAIDVIFSSALPTILFLSLRKNGHKRGEVHQVCHGGGRRSREDMYAHLLHQQQVPDCERISSLSLSSFDFF